MGKRLRWSAVPWLDTLADLRPFGPAENTVEQGQTITLGLLIPEPFGRDTTSMLTIRTENWRAGAVTLAITKVLTFDIEPDKPPMNMDLLRNPVRKVYPDDNGANEPDGD